MICEWRGKCIVVDWAEEEQKVDGNMLITLVEFVEELSVSIKN